MAQLFLDTGYALALAFPRDQHHQRAAALAREYDQPATRIVTTQAILLEVGNSLAAPALKSTGVEIIKGLRTDPRVTVVEVDNNLMARGLTLFWDRPDKQLTLALAYDQHFEQAGFRPLMRE
jgi:hypothetical protein